MNVSNAIDQFISENGGNPRDALNVALARLQLLEATKSGFAESDSVLYQALIKIANSLADGISPTDHKEWAKFYRETAETAIAEANKAVPLLEKKGNCNNQIEVLHAFAPEMLAFLQDIAFPKRGTEQETWTIEDCAAAAANLISRMNASVSE